MTQNQFDHFFEEFQQLKRLSDLADIEKSKRKTQENVFSAYKKSNDYNSLKKQIIQELTNMNPEWTKNYNEYDNHPKRVLPFPEIYDLTELDEKNFKFFYKEFEKLDNLFYKAYHIREDKSFDNIDEDDEDTTQSQLDEKNENKLKGFINGYYSINDVIEYNKQEDKITNELSKINQKWLEAKKETRLTRYEGDGIPVETFTFLRIYTLFEKLVNLNIEIGKLNENNSNSYTINKKQFDFEKLKKEILTMS